MESETSQSVGPVSTVYLYRTTVGLLRHEFAIVGLGSEKNPHVWLRIERAARMKARIVVADSLGPLFSGVESRDTVTFSKSRKNLFKSSDMEMASITLHLDHACRPPRLHLGEFGEQLHAATQLFPQVNVQLSWNDITADSTPIASTFCLLPIADGLRDGFFSTLQYERLHFLSAVIILHGRRDALPTTVWLRNFLRNLTGDPSFLVPREFSATLRLVLVLLIPASTTLVLISTV